MRTLSILLLLCSPLKLLSPWSVAAGDLGYSIDATARATVFSGTEKLHYSITWSGGVKIGDLYLETLPGTDSTYVIAARAIDYGLLQIIYPVDDRFTTAVQFPELLPLRYEVHQKEGRGSETRRHTVYDQQGREVRYRKNDQPEERFQVEGMVHNEFTGFYVTRVLDYANSNTLNVPTFADKKRHVVEVTAGTKGSMESLFGEVRTLELRPRMPFKGLYDKEGDTVIWITDDACRVPVVLSSRIVIGSLTATLINYDNPACPQYHGASLYGRSEKK